MKPQEMFPALGKRFAPLDLMSQIASHFVAENSIENDIAKQIVGSLRARDVKRAVEAASSIPLQQYGTWEEHLLMNQLSLLVRKIPWDVPGVDPELNAMKKFFASERKAARLNLRFRMERLTKRERYSTQRAAARRWIQKVIGREPDLLRIYSEGDFSSGAVVGIGGQDTSVYRKLSSSVSVTPSALPHWIEACWAHAQLRHLYCPKRTIGNTDDSWEVHCEDPDLFRENVIAKSDPISYNELFMVAKDWDCHRVAGKEPAANSFLQNGAGHFIFKRLAAFGMDLRRQEPNQRLAYAGSVESDNPLCTIDLSAASDSISIGLVRDLLPPAWFDFLMTIRSPAFKYGKRVERYSKMCSMGNGFCFPLETLIFASIVNAVYAETGDTVYRVYGDDIIVQQSSALYVLELLSWAGFKANKKKTFVFGPFRESCGADWYGGVNVRPHTVDEPPVRATDLCKIHNGFLYNPNVAKRTERTRAFIRSKLAAGYPAAPEDLTYAEDYSYQALRVPMDVFMADTKAKYVVDTQSWTWPELQQRGIPIDTSGYPTGQLMYGLLRGARPSGYGSFNKEIGEWIMWDHLPSATLRRKTRLSVTRRGGTAEAFCK